MCCGAWLLCGWEVVCGAFFERGGRGQEDEGEREMFVAAVDLCLTPRIWC